MGKNYLYIVFTGVFLVCASSAQALESKQNPKLVKFMQAVEAKDEEAIMNAWVSLSQDEKLLEYMENNLPNHYALYRIHGVKYRLQQVAKDQGVGSIPSVPDTVRRSLVGPGRSGSIANSEISRNSANQFRSSNTDYVRSFSNRDRSSNQSIVRSSPNQRSRSNQSRIRARRRR